MSAVSGKKIVLGITGSIAAYKSLFLIRMLVKEGAEVRVVITKDAISFVAPLTISTLSKNKVVSDLIDPVDSSWINHVELGLWADIMIIAPASANTIAKIAHGLCDNLLTAVYLSSRCPVFIAPAMDEDMWKHAATQKNISTITSYGNHLIQVETGELASGLIGPGRMAEAESIFRQIESFFIKKFTANSEKRALTGKRALVTAGPTHEAIDPVRFIGNNSSGKMGVAIAEALAEEGAEVELVIGPTAINVKNPKIKTVHITSAGEMYEEANRIFKQSDITVMAAAVADYTPEMPETEKLKKRDDAFLNLTLIKTPDILRSLGERKKTGQILVGFALETNDETANAKEKLRKKNLDFIVLNSLKNKGAGFQHDTNQITIIDKDEQLFLYGLKSKQEVARDIVNFIIKITKSNVATGNGIMK